MNKADVLKIFAENGLNDQGGNPHGWRCDHPDRYPDLCRCASEIAEEVINALAAHDAEVERRAAERALREAADVFEAMTDDYTSPMSSDEAASYAMLRDNAAGLRRHADRIAAEVS